MLIASKMSPFQKMQVRKKKEKNAWRGGGIFKCRIIVVGILSFFLIYEGRICVLLPVLPPCCCHINSEEK